ncbi:MAG TPA: alpha-2-macroglobulin family protein, partial [Alicycliphilus sp.]|nr:alpha-2-macroglobulin family protein [Alicycliphilus sp.]
GRRHYAKKAGPAGGGGGHAPTRELLDTLLLWQPVIKLDAQGQAKVTVPLNDALTTFKIVAVADAGTGLFGTGATSIRATQDLQIISGLPPLVREGDQFRAQITLRNTTAKAMQVEVAPRATLLQLDRQTVAIPPGEAREVVWNVTAPEQLGQARAQAILWEIEARDTTNGARDALKASQRLIPAVPLAVQQATLVQVNGGYQAQVAPPANAIAGRGGLKLSLQPKLAEGLPGVRDWWANYPFSCLEQKASKAMGLADAGLWKSVVAQLPTYLDGDGLANYFPPRDGAAARGSDTLTAYLLASSHEAAGLHPEFALPPELREPMERGLIAFVEGRIERSFWSPRKDLDVRKLAAIEALSRYGKAQPRWLTSITIAPNQGPTPALIDWINILKRVDGVPQRGQQLAQAMNILRARLSYQGGRLGFSTEQDDAWWWLMQGGDVNSARLLLAVLDDPAWKEDLGRLASGFIARQQGGAWHTTTANLWGGLALEKFSARFEATPVTGSTRASMGGNAASVDWSKVARVTAEGSSGAANQTTWFGAPAAPGGLANNAMFLPWPRAMGPQSLDVTHQGTGKPWLTLQSVAAVERKAPFNAGFAIKRTVTPVEQAGKSLPAGSYARGDVLRVTLEVTAGSDMSWVAITDPSPAGATILGSGLGRDSEIATQGEKRQGPGWPAFEERSFESFRRYYEYLPKGTVTMQYTLRLNNAGDFALPPSRVEALYAPEMFGEAPNARVKVVAGP